MFKSRRWPAACLLALATAAVPGISAAQAAKRLDAARPIPISGLVGSLQNPCWSPQGDRLAITQFTKRYNEGKAIVRIVPAAGGSPVATLSPTSAQSVNLPGSCWNALTSLVTYTSDPEVGDQVFVVPASGGQPQAVTHPPLVAFEPSLSPDGQWIVFEKFRQSRSEIWKVRLDGTGLQRLTKRFDDRQPNWSPRGDRIVFQRHRRGGSDQPGDLWTINPNGRRKRNVTRTRGLQETDASWSPSGRFLVFSSDAGNVDVASLFTMAEDGERRRQLTRTRGIYDGAPSWSPDGRTIVFESYAGDPDGSRGTQIWAIPAPVEPVAPRDMLHRHSWLDRVPSVYRTEQV